jgi:hypothetical protein
MTTKQQPQFKVGDRVVHSGMKAESVGTVVEVPKILRSGYSVLIDGDRKPLIGVDEEDLRLYEREKSR